MFRFAPDGSAPTSEFQKYTGLRNKARVARDKGAVGLMMVTGPADATDDDLPKLAIDQGAGSSGIPAVSITRASIETSLQYSGWSLTALQDKIRGEKKPHLIPDQGCKCYASDGHRAGDLTNIERDRLPRRQ